MKITLVKMVKSCWTWILMQSLSESVCFFLEGLEFRTSRVQSDFISHIGSDRMLKCSSTLFPAALKCWQQRHLLPLWKQSRLKMDIKLPSWFCEFHRFIFQKENLEFASADYWNPLHYYSISLGEMAILATGWPPKYVHTSIFPYQVEASMAKRNR